MREVLRLLRIREKIGRDDAAAARVDLDAQHVGRDDDTAATRPRSSSSVGVAVAARRGFAGVVLALGISPCPRTLSLAPELRARPAWTTQLPAAQMHQRVAVVLLPLRPEQVAEEQERDQQQVAGTRHGDLIHASGTTSRIGAVAMLGVGAADRRRTEDQEKGAKNQARIVPGRRPPFNRARLSARRRHSASRSARSVALSCASALSRAISRMSIAGRSRANLAKALARDALDAVAAHRVGRDAARHGKAQAARCRSRQR